MLNHWRSAHDGVSQLPKIQADVSGPENMIVSESCWCIKGINDDGTATAANGAGNWVPCTERLNSIRKHVADLFVHDNLLLMHSETSHGSTKAGCFKCASQPSTCRCSFG